MAITALATQNTTIGPSQFADMQVPTGLPFHVDGPDDLKPTKSGRVVSIAAGKAMAGGSRIVSTAKESVTCDPQTAGSRWDTICIRIDWQTPSCSLVAIKGNNNSIPINHSQAPDPLKINRIPGVLYDAMICSAAVSSSGIGNLLDLRPWGGQGGPYRLPDASIESASLLDAPIGTWVNTDRDLQTRRLDDDGTWRVVGTASNPWRTWTPTLRYYGTGTVNGVSGGTVAGNGNTPSVQARYRVIDGIVDAYLFIQAGSTGATWGDGSMTVDLPLKASAAMFDNWSSGHLFTSGYGGDGSYDWDAQALIKPSWTRAMLWTNSRIDDCRLVPYSCQRPQGGPGTGAPYIKGGYPVGAWTFNLRYPTDA